MPALAQALGHSSRNARAARLARRLSPTDTWEDARDRLDLATGGELEADELDALTDLAIEARVEASASREPRRTRLHALIAAGATIAELAAVFGPREAAAVVVAE